MPKNAAHKKSTTIDNKEVRQFNALAQSWWDEAGPLKPLHVMNPARLGYFKKQICTHFRRNEDSLTPFTALRVLDVGCGGGLVTEPFRRLGADVTGIDAGEENIRVAREHARRQGLDIAYQPMTAEALAASGEKFDVVLALEIVEHVSDAGLFIASCCRLVERGGIIIFSTLNRTPKSFLLGIVAAEYLLRWVPRGTHDWKKFLRPSEIAREAERNGLRIIDVSGLVYDPLRRVFRISRKDTGVNSFLTAVRE